MSSTMVSVLGINAGLARPADPHAHHRHDVIRRRRDQRLARRRALATRLQMMVSDRPRPWPTEPDAELA
jgi:hypothetical protein